MGSDGAAGLVLASGAKARADDSQWGAMTASYCYSWVLCGFLQALELFTSPALAIPKAIASAGIEQSQVNFYEINEAFAVRIILVPHCKILSY
jgi:acetyl-CoA C-acetyltransferase